MPPVMLIALHYIEVPDLGPCATCGLVTHVAETHAETWLCPGPCTNSYLRVEGEPQPAEQGETRAS